MDHHSVQKHGTVLVLIINNYFCTSETTTQIPPTVPATSLQTTTPTAEKNTNEISGKNLY